MLEFQLFRIKVYPGAGDLFEKARTPQEALHEVVKSLPAAELRKGQRWHIGNLSSIGDKGLYFRLGRTSKERLEVFKDGIFADQDFETAPYTHAIMHIDLEVIAIARKNRLGPTTKAIAHQLEKLLNNSESNRLIKARFEIGEILDPEDFISHLTSAYSIKRFWFKFSCPNPWDAERDFVQPMQSFLKESQGDEGKTTIEGGNLQPGTLEAIARSAAATGDDAGAVLQLEQGQPTVKKALHGSPASVKQDDVDDEPKKNQLLNAVIGLYHRIRGNHQGS